jgi:hypothetical protein
MCRLVGVQCGSMGLWLTCCGLQISGTIQQDCHIPLLLPEDANRSMIASSMHVQRKQYADSPYCVGEYLLGFG